MNASKTNLRQLNISDDYFQKNDMRISLQSRLYRWTGLANISEGWKAYQKNDIRFALKSAGIGLAKLGTLAAACYGTYRWTAGHVVHINDFLTQAEKDFNNQKHRSFVPTSVVRLTQAFYDEQKTFSKWPKSGKEFVFKHLASDAPMSSAILKYLIETAEKKEDSTLKRPLIKECKTSSSESCVTVAESYTGESHPDALSNAMSMLGQCRKSTNAFCGTVIENAKKQSVKSESLADIASLMRQIAKRPQDIQKNRDFAEKGISLFQPHIAKLQTAIGDCQQAKPLLKARAWEDCPNWWSVKYQSPVERLIAQQDHCVKEKYAEFEKFWTPCFSHADFFEKLAGWDLGHKEWWQEKYLNDKTDELTKTLQNSLSDQAVGLSEFCSLISGSSICQNFIEKTFDDLIDANLPDHAMKLMMNSKGALIGRLSDVLAKLGTREKWKEAIQFLLSFSKSNPEANLTTQTQFLWSQVMESSEAYLAFDLLALNVSLDAEKTINKAFSNTEENHLHRIYLAAKSWIEKKDAQHDQHLKLIIKNLFSMHYPVYDYYSSYNLEKDMARILVTKWMYAKDPNSILASTLEAPHWRLTQKSDSYWDRYSNTITKENWEQKLNVM